jgi:hypothetical protein
MSYQFIYKKVGSFEPPADTSNKRCRVSVHERGRGVRMYQCTKKAITVVDGYGYCAIHSPDAVKRREEKSKRLWEEKIELEKKRYGKTCHSCFETKSVLQTAKEAMIDVLDYVSESAYMEDLDDKTWFSKVQALRSVVSKIESMEK